MGARFFALPPAAHENPRPGEPACQARDSPHIRAPFMITLFTILEVLVCLLLILLILMQRPRQEGLGASFGEGVTNQMWGAQTTNVLQKGTGWLAGALFAITVVLAMLTTSKHNSGNANPLFSAKPEAAAPATPAPAAPAAATTPAPASATTPAAPAAPAVQVSKQPGGTVTVTPGKPADAPKADAKPAAAPAAPKADAPKPAPAPKADAKPAAAPAATPTPAPAK